MATYELTIAYFLIGSILPLMILFSDPDTIGTARLAAGLTDDNRFMVAIMFYFLFWPVVFIVAILVLAGVLKPEDHI